ncbi:MAG: cation transporter [Deltaproteobacteria bacterium]|nr:cation transporter [Deltaproteobacteria bacterium]
MAKQTFSISNISCGHCVATIQNELQELDGVVKVDADSQSKTATVEWDAPATESQIKSKLSEIGYPTST